VRFLGQVIEFDVHRVSFGLSATDRQAHEQDAVAVDGHLFWHESAVIHKGGLGGLDRAGFDGVVADADTAGVFDNDTDN